MTKKYFFASNISQEIRHQIIKIFDQNLYLHGHLIKENKRRKVYYYTLPSGENIYIKKDTPPDVRNKIKNLWRWKAESEFQSAQLLQSLGISIAPLIAWIKEGKNTFLVTQEFSNAITLTQAFEQYPQEQKTLFSFCKTIFILFWENHLDHPDMHFDNLLMRYISPGNWEYAFIDTYGIKIKPSPLGKIHLLKFYLSFYYRYSHSQQKQLNSEMSQHLNISSQTFLHLVYRTYMFQWKKLKTHFTNSHKKRLLKFFSHQILWETKLPENILSEINDLFFSNQFQQLKNDTKRQVYRITTSQGKSFILKTYTHHHWKPIFLKLDYQCWINTHFLSCLQVPVAKVLAWGTSPNHIGYIILEDVGNLPIHKYIDQLSQKEKEETACLLGEFLALLHNYNIYHSDLKKANIHVIPEVTQGWILRLLDCDKINTRRPITQKMIKHNLEQLALAFTPNDEDTNFDPHIYQLIQSSYMKNKIPKKILENFGIF